MLDFNLAAFELVGGRIRPSVRPIDFNQIAGKMCHGHLTGTVANLNAGVGFDLQERDGGTIHVNLTSTTVVSGDSGQTATLANGANVDVEGAVDTTTSTVTAAAVHVRSAANPAPAQNVAGTVATVNAGAGSFTVTVERASHVLPTGGTITVQTDSSTVFHARPGDSVSIANVAMGEVVLVNGTFNSAS